MRFKLAILNVLAKSPGGRATFDEVRRGVRVIIASGDQSEQLKRFSEFGDIDIFQSGLVLRDDAGLEITDAGLSLLHSLGSSSEPSLEFSSAPAPQPLDDLSDTDERLKNFDLELAMPGNDAQDDERRTAIRSKPLTPRQRLVQSIRLQAPGPEVAIGIEGLLGLPALRPSSRRNKNPSSALHDAISHNGIGTRRMAKMNAWSEIREALHLQSSAWYWSLRASSQPLHLVRYNP